MKEIEFKKIELEDKLKKEMKSEELKMEKLFIKKKKKKALLYLQQLRQMLIQKK